MCNKDNSEKFYNYLFILFIICWMGIGICSVTAAYLATGLVAALIAAAIYLFITMVIIVMGSPTIDKMKYWGNYDLVYVRYPFRA